MKQKIRNIVAVAGSLLYCNLLIPCAVYAGNKEDKIVKDLDSKMSFFVDLVLTLIQGGGAIVFGLGCVSLFSAISSRNSTELTEGILKTASGLGMFLVPLIVRLYA